MENLYKPEPPKPELIQISEEEIGIINDIRRINFGRITVFVQNGVIVSKEITTITKNNKRKNDDSSKNCAYEEDQYM